MTIIGNPILLSGGGNTAGSLFNFPISISSTEPTAEIEGHIWINTTRGDNITSVHIVDKPTTDLPNNSLIFEVIDTRNTSMSLVQDFKVSGIGTIKMAYQNEGVGNHPWLVNSDENNTTYLAYPRVFIKADNVLYLETAYVWTGTYWMLLSQADTYLFTLIANDTIASNSPSSYAYCPIQIYNVTDNTYVKHDDIAATEKNRAKCLTISESNGTYVGYQDYNDTIQIYKRVGDTFTLYFSMGRNDIVNYLPEEYANLYYCRAENGYSYCPSIKLSAIGDYLAVTYVTQAEESYSYSGYTKSGVLILKNNGTTFEYCSNFDVASVYCNGGSNSPNNSSCGVYASDDFSVLIVASSLYYYNSNGNSSSYIYNHLLTGSPNSYNVQEVKESYYQQELLCALSKDGSCAVMTTKNTSSSDPSYYTYVYSINKNSNSCKNIGTINYRSYHNVVEDIYISADNEIWLTRQSNSTTGELVYLEHGKVVDGVFTKLTTGYALTDGNGNYIYNAYDSDTSGSSYVYNDIVIDLKNNLMYIASRLYIYVCSMTKSDTGALTALTQVATIAKTDSHVMHNEIALTPIVVM